MEVDLSPKQKAASQFTREAPNGWEDASISTSFWPCLSLFEALVSKLEFEPVRDEGGSYGIWNDELGRLKIWATNIGAHQRGQSSLDFRLRDASHIRDEVLTLIEDLQRTLQDVDDVLNDPTPSEEDVAPGPARADGAHETEMQQLHRSTMAVVRCLLQLTMVVRNPAQHSLLTEKQTPDVAAFEPFDIDHVRNKYPAANETLARRLGLALTRRRKLLAYRERHHAKLNRGIDLDRGLAIEENASLLSGTLATDFQDLNAAHDLDSTRSQVSRTSFASSLWAAGSTTIPEPPDNAIKGPPFECPYCYYIIIIENTREWRKHIFADILPYVCTEIDCATPHRLYTSRRDWINHRERVHIEQQGTQHHDPRTGHRPASISTGSELECPLCMKCFGLEKEWEDHLAQHLQELALFVLPQADGDFKDDSIDEYSRRSDRNDPSASEDDQAKVPRDTREDPLEESFIDGDGIHPEVIQAKIERYLGAGASCRPGVGNGINGYIVIARRPFTPKMLVDLRTLSDKCAREVREGRSRSYQDVLASEDYRQSQTKRDRDQYSGVPGSQFDLYDSSDWQETRYDGVQPKMTQQDRILEDLGENYDWYEEIDISNDNDYQYLDDNDHKRRYDDWKKKYGKSKRINESELV